jgi:hypothetical protein
VKLMSGWLVKSAVPLVAIIAVAVPASGGGAARASAGVPAASASDSARATTPRPAPGDPPGVSTTAYGGISVFYRTATTNTLTHRSGTSAQWNAPENLGGRLISGPSAITIGSEFATTWAFVVGADNRVWYRGFSDGLGEWSRWLTIGGFAAGPTTTCVGDVSAQPIVYVMGRDFALWRRALAGGRGSGSAASS